MTADEAISCLPDGEYIHTYLNGAGLLLFADWSREDVEACLRANSCEMAGPEARKMGHGIVIDGYEGKRRALFIETVEEQLVKFDKGDELPVYSEAEKERIIRATAQLEWLRRRYEEVGWWVEDAVSEDTVFRASFCGVYGLLRRDSDRDVWLSWADDSAIEKFESLSQAAAHLVEHIKKGVSGD